MYEIRFFPPDDSLTPYVNGYLFSSYTLDGTEKPFFTPKGTAALVINIEISESSYLEYPKPDVKLYFEKYAPYLFGQMSRLGKSHLDGQFAPFVIVFTPTGLYQFLDEPSNQMTDKAYKLEDLGYHELANKLKNLFATASRVEDCIPELNRILSDYFSTKTFKSPAFDMAPVANEILLSNGLVSLDALIDRLKINPRTFQIQFKNQVGLSPKLFCRITRFNSLLVALDQNPKADLLELALDFGYSDNPHLYKDFKQFVGMTPRQYLRLILNINSKVELELKRNPPKLKPS